MAAGGNNRLSIFHTTCWVLGLLAFVELAAVGLALGLKRENQEPTIVPEPRVIERIVTEYKTLPQQERTVVVEKPIYIEKEVGELPDGPPTFVPERVEVQLRAPRIDNPIVERLVEEARGLRVGGDSMRALLKLEEAAKTAPKDANVLYQFAEVFETMGLYDKAADHYQEVFALGTTGAGSLYELAAVKLRDGIDQAEDMSGKFALGRVRVFRDKSWTEGERVILTVPVSAAPGLMQDEAELSKSMRVSVYFYDKLDGEVVLRDEFSSSMDDRWVTPPIDWQDGGEELLRVIYEVPTESGGAAHLLGQRVYFGQVVELYYEGALIDRMASPRTLANEVNARGSELEYYPDNYVPDDFNFENPLLPPLP